MANQPESPGSSRTSRSQRRRMGWTIRITPGGVLILIFLNLIILAGWTYGLNRLMRGYNLPEQLTPSSSEPILTATATNDAPTSTTTVQPTTSPTTRPSASSTPVPPTASPKPIGTLSINQGLIILALNEGGNTHLFAYQPEEAGEGQPLPLTRITYGPWDDINPAISPDGQRVAFASNRNGYWDIYLLELGSGSVTRLTDSPEYKAAPSWSPDNKWVVYEAYLNENLEIVIKSAVTSEEPIQLTVNPAADFSPVWSPAGRQIIFVSDRTGEDDIWLADLDKGEEQRFQNISQNPDSKDIHPAFSPDGTSLVWVGEQDSIRNLYLQKLPIASEATITPSALIRENLGNGDWPVWSADGETILTVLQAPNRTYLTAYPSRYLGLALPALELPGSVHGISWGNVSLSSPLQEIYQPAILAPATPLFVPEVTGSPGDNGGRYQLSPLADVEAPHPYLHDLVDESFQALRMSIATEAGWDFLSTLENAYVPLTSPLEPGMGSDWLYTGRAIALNTLSITADWMVVVKENFGSETYWQVYIRALSQDGSAGMPLHDRPWNFNARNNGDTLAYDRGGALQGSIPPGYWIDFTERALSYGWERLPALPNWNAYYPAARFNEFVTTGGLEWYPAMLELYPPEAMITPSPVAPPTFTPTYTPWWYESPTPTSTPTPRPTFKPIQTTPANPPTSSPPQDITPAPGG